MRILSITYNFFRGPRQHVILAAKPKPKPDSKAGKGKK